MTSIENPQGIPADPPAPAQADVEQRPMVNYPAVDVNVVGPVQIQAQPARTGIIDVVYLPAGGRRVPLVPPDMRRQSITFVCADTYYIASKRDGLYGVAASPLTMHHASEVWAKTEDDASEDVPVTVITEFYAQ